MSTAVRDFRLHLEWSRAVAETLEELPSELLQELARGGLGDDSGRDVTQQSSSTGFGISDLRDPSPSQILGTSSRFSWTS